MCAHCLVYLTKIHKHDFLWQEMNTLNLIAFIPVPKSPSGDPDPLYFLGFTMLVVFTLWFCKWLFLTSIRIPLIMKERGRQKKEFELHAARILKNQERDRMYAAEQRSLGRILLPCGRWENEICDCPRVLIGYRRYSSFGPHGGIHDHKDPIYERRCRLN